ncbi:FAD-dependent oxidoreductase [Bacillus cereus]|uniref:FAD-dependent oxidoreductase n=1 Tax=Bacillus cereus TaxID=1396 RepID=UPI000BECB109|nr:FAD-dependent oxidoreductase [Bacillus cereus]PEF61819.1 FAD-binding monooxygenase [Bacillus cereus]
MKKHYDVAIIGGGPVGLMAACELAIQGVKVILLEKREDLIRNSRALTLHPRSLEIFAMRGIVERFLTKGKPLETAHYAGLETRLKFSKLETDFPYTLFIPQSMTEKILREHALALGVEIRNGHSLIQLKQHKDSVWISVKNMEDIYHLVVNYVIGADGARSSVRQFSQIPFNGTETNVTAILGDVRLDTNSFPSFFSTTTEKGSIMGGPVTPGVVRIAVIDLNHQYISKKVPVTEKELQDGVYRITGKKIQIKESLWLSRFGNATKLAGMYQNARVFLAGDAAHIHFPAGGQGLNVGLQDAFNLGWKLGLSIKQNKHGALLESYHFERYEVGKQFVKETLAQEQIMMNFSPSGLALRDVLSRLLTYSEVNQDLAEKVSGIGVMYPLASKMEVHPWIGKRCPNFPIYLHNQQKKKLYTLMHDGHFIVILPPSQAHLLENITVPSYVKLIIGQVEHPAFEEQQIISIRPGSYILGCIKPERASESSRRYSLTVF